MKIFQRIEVWLLLALAAGSILLVFHPFSHKDAAPSPVPADGQSGLLIQVHRLSLVRDFGNARLDLDVRLTNKRAKTVPLVAPGIKLTTGAGRPVPEFFLPVEPPPEITAQTTADFHLRYWLEKADLNGRLTLEFDGEKVELKSDKPFDLDQLKNNEPKTLGIGEW